MRQKTRTAGSTPIFFLISIYCLPDRQCEYCMNELINYTGRLFMYVDQVDLKVSEVVTGIFNRTMLLYTNGNFLIYLLLFGDD